MSGECILIIDDSQEMASHLGEQLLPAFGFRTIQATNGQTGLQIIREQKPDLVMLDLNLPRMTGLDVLQALTAEALDVPVILMTGYGSEKSAIDAFRLGIKDYLVKPFTVEEVLEIIDRALLETRLRHDKERLIVQLRRAEADTRRQLSELNLFLSAGKELLMLKQADAILQYCLSMALRLTNAEMSAIWLPDPETDKLLAYMHGDEVQRRPEFDLPANAMLIGGVYQTGLPFHDAVFSGEGLQLLPGLMARAALLVPLTLRQKVVGVLGVTNKIAPQAFSEREQLMLASLADYTAIALHNAALGQAYESGPANRPLDMFDTQTVMTVSHDLRAPLNSIVGFVDMLSQTTPLNEQQELFLRHIADSAERMMRLVDSLLDLARLDSGLPEARQLCNLTAILADVTMDLRGKALANEIQLVVDTGPDLRPVEGNAARLTQAISNLVDNALKFSPAGGTVRITLTCEGKTMQVRVSDQGRGIDEQYLPHIFDRFFRIENDPNVGGFGLGLTLARSITEAHGGRVTVESRVGQGSTFVMHLPAYMGSELLPSARSASARSGSA